MDNRKSIIGGGISLLVILVAVCVWLIWRPDPALAKLQELGDQMNQEGLSDAQRDQMRDQFRQQMQGLTDGQRRAFFDANRGQWEARSAERMNQFFAMSKVDQTKRLDEILNRMNQPRTQNAGGRDQNGRGANGGGGNRGGRSMTEAQREERSKRRLDNTSPKQRAQFTQFRKMLDQRASQRGIKIDDGGGRGGWRS